MTDKKQPVTGKGDKPRTTNNQNWRNRFDEIRDFGFKPKWEREIELDKKKKRTLISKYAHQSRNNCRFFQSRRLPTYDFCS